LEKAAAFGGKADTSEVFYYPQADMRTKGESLKPDLVGKRTIPVSFNVCGGSHALQIKSSLGCARGP